MRNNFTLGLMMVATGAAGIWAGWQMEAGIGFRPPVVITVGLWILIAAGQVLAATAAGRFLASKAQRKDKA